MNIKSWTPWHMARVATSLFILMVSSYYLVVGFDNVTNPTNPNASNWGFVQGVLKGDGVPAGSGFEWRFIDATWFHAISYIAIMALEILTGILLLVAGILGLKHAQNPEHWSRSQKWTFAGGLIGLGIFFFGFIVVGGNWFIMYLNSKWNGLDPAFQNSVMTVSMLVLTTAVMIGSQTSRERDRSS